MAVESGVLVGDRSTTQFGFPEKPFELSVELAVVEDEWNIRPSEGCKLRYDSSAGLDRAPTNWPIPPFGNSAQLLQTGGVYAVLRDEDLLLLEFTHLPSVRRGASSEISARYRLVTNSFQSSTSDSGELLGAIDDALQALSQVRPYPSDVTAGLGHNNPPPDSALSIEDYAAVTDTLRELRSGIGANTLGRKALQTAQQKLQAAFAQINKWARRRLELVEEGFYRGIGTAVATGVVGIGLWLVVGGKIQTVTELIAKFAGHLLGVT